MTFLTVQFCLRERDDEGNQKGVIKSAPRVNSTANIQTFESEEGSLECPTMNTHNQSFSAFIVTIFDGVHSKHGHRPASIVHRTCGLYHIPQV